jgi:hypothetical protein
LPRPVLLVLNGVGCVVITLPSQLGVSEFFVAEVAGETGELVNVGRVLGVGSLFGSSLLFFVIILVQMFFLEF